MIRPILLALSITIAAVSSALHAEVATYKLDASHSSVGFRIRHFVTKVPGHFAKFDADIQFDEANPANSKVSATINAASIDTNHADRDKHLQNDDFFKVGKFPEIKFVSTTWKKTGDNTYDVTGDLTMLEQTKPVVLAVTYLGQTPGRGGKMLAGWEATAKIDRTAWGISYGLPAVGKDVEIEINIEGVLQK